MNKAVLYCRVSSREQEETGYSLAAQEKLLEEYALKKGYTIAKVFRVSESASGAKQREVFTEMVQYLEKRSLRILICEKTDRLTRSRRDAVIIDEWVRKDPENQTHFVKENFILNRDSRANEKFIWGIKVEVAQYYTNNLSEEVKKGQKEKLSQGQLPSRSPLGYKTIGEGGHKTHVLDEEKASYIRRAFEYYASGNYTLTSLRDKLYEEGLRTQTGRRLNKSGIEKMFRNPYYCGSIRWNAVVYNGMHPPMVSQELFEKVAYMLTRKKAPHYKRHIFKFSKSVTCGECGGIISGEIQKGHIYYSCKHGKTCTQRGTTREEDIENKLLGVFNFFETITSEEAEEIYSRIRADHQLEADYKEGALSTLNQRYALLQRQLDILYDDRLAEKITQERWEAKQATINQEQAGILSQVEKIKSDETKYFEIYINILDLARRAREIYEKRSPEQRRLLLSYIFSNLVLKDKKTNYSLKKATEAYSKRVQEKIDAEKKFELTKNGSTKRKNGVSVPAFSPLLGRKESNLH